MRRRTTPSKAHRLRECPLRPCLKIEQFEQRLLLANDLRLVKDLVPQFSTDVNSYGEAVEVGSTLYFMASSTARGEELWKSDGTLAGTQLVKDINPGVADSRPRDLLNVNGLLYFAANDGTHGIELWRSDGTEAGTVMVGEVRAGSASSYVTVVANLGNTVYFRAVPPFNGNFERAFMVEGPDKPIVQWGNLPLTDALNVNGTMYLAIRDTSMFPSTSRLYKSNGTLAGTSQFKDMNGAVSEFVDFNGKLAFLSLPPFGSSRELWQSDGTNAGTTIIINNTSLISAVAEGERLVNFGGQLYFTKNDGTSGHELWKSDGTAIGSVLVKDIVPGTLASTPEFKGKLGNALFFRITTASGSQELWKTDGTAAGTVLLKDINPSKFVELGGVGYFRAFQSTTGNEVWRTDGTTAGTVLMKEFIEGPSSGALSLSKAGNKLFIRTLNQATLISYELWASDGTSNGTNFVKDFRQFASSNPTNMMSVNGILFFTADDGVSGLELWRSDGTAAGTYVLDVRPGSASSSPRGFTNANGTLYFFANDGTRGAELWKSDGTVAGTQLVKDLNPGTNGSAYDPAFSPGAITNLGNIVYFTAFTPATGGEMWRSDGTDSGTTLVTDLAPGTAFSSPALFRVVNSTLYFTAVTAATGRELWKSDGTAANTLLVKDLTPGTSNSFISSPIALQGQLFFELSNSLWVSDGTSDGTISLLSNVFEFTQKTVLNGELYFVRVGDELWKTNGTVAGTSLVIDQNNSISSLTTVNSQLYFFVASGNDRGLWASDGTSAGTRLIKSLSSQYSFPIKQVIANLNGNLYFTGLASARTALWTSDGTSEGTAPVLDSSGRAVPEVTSNLVEVAGSIYYGGWREEFGNELFALVATDFGDAPFATRLVDNGARHIAVGPRLGARRDTGEPDGLPTPTANGDDTNGNDDEDGLQSPSSLQAGSSYALRVAVNNATTDTRLFAWFDWNQDGDWQDAGENVLAGVTVTDGINQQNIAVPASAKFGTSIARIRIANHATLSSLGLANSGEVEDYAFEVASGLLLDLTAASSNNLTIRRSSNDLVVFNNVTQTNIVTAPLTLITSLQILGSSSGADTILVDYASGGFFTLPGGIDLRGQGGTDAVTIKGLGSSIGNYSQTSAARRFELVDNALLSSVLMSDFESLNFQALQRFNVNSNLDVGAASISIEATQPIDLPQQTSIGGGQLTAKEMILGTNESLTGAGSIASQFTGQSGSRITLSGNLTIGDTTSTSGFAMQGETVIDAHTLTLMDLDQAALGSTTRLSATDQPGTLTAANGLTVSTGAIVSGFGTLQTPNSADKSLTNSGSMLGQTSSRPLTVAGYLRGTGTLDLVNIQGTYDPQAGPLSVTHNRVQYAGKLMADIGGTTAGTSYDQYQHTGTATLGGELQVQLINGHQPTTATAYELLRADGGVVGTFASLNLPTPPVGKNWQVLYRTNSVQLALRELTLTIDAVSISELNGTTTARVRRTASDTLEALTINLTSSDTSEATVPPSVTIAAGSVEAVFQIQAVDDTLLDGTQSLSITASANGYLPVSASLNVTDVETLTLSIAPATISELNGSAIGRVKRNNTNIDQPQIVQLTSADVTEAAVPAAITIQAGQSEATFAITAVDDTLLDGPQTFDLRVAADGYVGHSTAITVEDYETLAVMINTGAINEVGGLATGTVTRSNTNIALPLVVALSSSLTSEATVPANVTIPAGAASITFPITAVDDGVLDGTKSVQITASAAGYVSGSSSLNVTDSVLLTVSLSAATISEASGTSTALVTRSNSNISAPLLVQLQSSDTTEATVPSSITIPAGAASVSFVITGVDDTLLDGMQTVVVTASATGYQNGSVSIQVTDAESLELVYSATSMNESGGAITATVSRSNTDIGQPIIVQLSNSDTSEAAVPASVTIPAGQASATFNITSVDDTLLDGTQSVTVRATSNGYFEGTRALEVTDHETLTLTIDSASISEQSGAAVGTVSRSNTNLDQPITVQLSSSDTSAATVPASVTIPVGQASATFTITAVDDTLLDGTQSVTVRATSNGYFEGTHSLNVTDHETLTIAIDNASISEQSGSAIGTVSRSNTNLDQPITVQLSSSDTSEGTVPASVTIPAGQASVTFTITAVDDTLLDGTQSVTLRATSSGYIGGNRSLSVTDHETLTLTIDTASISEQAGSAVGTVSRSNTNLDQPISVQLSSSDTSEATVPASVTIPAGQAAATFTITAVDDTLLDGTQSVTVRATSDGYFEGNRSLDVADHETLMVTIDAASISEQSGSAIGTVSRSNTNLDQPISVQLSSSDTSEATVPASVTIPAGQAAATFTVTAVDDLLLDGTQSVTVLATSSGYFDGNRSLDVVDHETLTVTIDTASISEQAGSAIGTVSRSNTNLGQTITVQLSSSDTGEATVPASVTIPAGQASATFTISAVDDILLDGTQSVTVRATSSGYFEGNKSLDVTDHETLMITIDTASISEQAGSATGTVTRSNTDLDRAITVSLSSNDASEATVPASVTIPAGQDSVTFTIPAVDDTLLDGTQSVTVRATSSGYFEGNRSLDVTDHETLTVAIDTAPISEQAGSAIGTVSRSNTDLDQPITVQLSSSDTSEATVPASVTIPAGQSSVTFTITAVDDTLLDGTQSLTVRATSDGYFEGNRSLEVTDHETLTVTLDTTSISEQSGSATGTVSRNNTDLDQAITVQLSSSDISEATVPASVTIAAGQASATFTISAVDDTLIDGTQSVTVRATSSGYFEGNRVLDVTDNETLAVTIDTTSISEQAGFATGTVSRSNTDLDQTITVQLSSSDTSEATVPASVTIPAGQSSVTFTITAVDDTLLDGTQSATVRATSTGYVEGNRSLDVTDHETLTVTIDTASISEQAGAATGTVTRSNTDLDQPITVQLSSGDTSEATVPASVTIPAGQASATFTISAVDDALLDGTQSATVRATSTGYIEGNRSLDVTDHETLTVRIDTASISEKNGSGIGTISRSNTDIDQAITVQLSSSDTSEATVPAGVTIPAGQSIVTFTVTAVDDTLLDSAQVVVIATAALGYEGSTVEVNITDDERQFPWQNPRNPLDVNDDGFVTAIDALLVINALNTGFQLPPQLPDPFIPVQYLDVNGNGSVTPIDALLVINELNRPRNPEGEGLAFERNESMPSDDSSVLDVLTEEWLRLRRRSTIK